MNFADIIALALRNLRQAKLRTRPNALYFMCMITARTHLSPCRFLQSSFQYRIILAFSPEKSIALIVMQSGDSSSHARREYYFIDRR